MSTGMMTLHEIAVRHAKKQSGMVDSLTEEAPILDHVRWKAATHGLWNVAEKLTDVEGAAFVEPDAPLPNLSVSTDLVTTDLNVMGGTMEVPTQRAKKFGGPAKYFADKQNYILKKAGMDTERQLVFENWLKGAKATKNLYDAGGKGDGFFILAVRFDELSNVGLFDPDQFDSGRLLKIDFPYGGEEHYLHSPRYEGVLGYSVTYRGNFGYQMLDAARTVQAHAGHDRRHAGDGAFPAGQHLPVHQPARQDLRHQPVQGGPRAAGQRRCRRQDAGRDVGRRFHRHFAQHRGKDRPRRRGVGRRRIWL